jgi:transposase
MRQRTRLKNHVHGILSRNLVPTCPHADLFSAVGRKWLSGQDLPSDEWRSVEALLGQLDFHGDELAAVERDIAIDALD